MSVSLVGLGWLVGHVRWIWSPLSRSDPVTESWCLVKYSYCVHVATCRQALKESKFLIKWEPKKVVLVNKGDYNKKGAIAHTKSIPSHPTYMVLVLGVLVLVVLVVLEVLIVLLVLAVVAIVAAVVWLVMANHDRGSVVAM